MSVSQKRDCVLERIYDDLLSYDSLSLEEAVRLADIADKLEDARRDDCNRAQEAVIKELERKQASDFKDLEVIEHTQQDKNKQSEVIATICSSAITSLVWMFFMAYEMHKTRKFEEENVETSSVSKWLKNSFPKFKAI